MNHLTFQFKKATLEDAVRLVDLIKNLDEETEFMLFEPDERKQSVEQLENFLKELENSPSKALFVADIGDKLIGLVVGIGGIANRNRHCCYIVIGVLKEYWGQGVGQRLLANLQAWAETQSMHRLELTVMAHNQRAIALYEKFGLVREGVKRQSMRVSGQFVDDLYMSNSFKLSLPARKA